MAEAPAPAAAPAPTAAPAPAPAPAPASPGLSQLPNELLLTILTHLPGYDLTRAAAACRRLRALAADDSLWRGLVASMRLRSPAPYATYRELWIHLHPHLWLHGALWFSDRRYTGYTLAGHYNARTGQIELVHVCAHKSGRTASDTAFHALSSDASVYVSAFAPSVRRWDEPLVRLDATTVVNADGEIEYRAAGHSAFAPAVMCSLLRAKALPPHLQTPGMSLWPPALLPLAQRARNLSHDQFRGTSHRPRTPAEASPDVFRLRKWVQFGALSGMPLPLPRFGGGGAMDDHDTETFAALRADAWRATPTRPWQGLWVGDYSTHGCELILFHQPAERVLHAVKITGDRNVPRGELTFVADDLHNVLRVATDPEWPGARVVPARGQIAETGFEHTQWLDGHLLLVSPDEVAMYWDFVQIGMPHAHISRFRRVDADEIVFGSGNIDFGTPREAE